ncbi:MAG: hypothetical protein WCR42_08260 [bacterium]
MKNNISIFIIIIIFCFLSSCSEDTEYHFVVKNETNYKLDVVGLDWGSGPNKISVEPNSVLTDVKLKYSGGFEIEPAALCVGVETYSDSNSIYTNTYGIATGRDGLSGNDTIIFTIDPEPYYESDIFKIEIRH